MRHFWVTSDQGGSVGRKRGAEDSVESDERGRCECEEPPRGSRPRVATRPRPPQSGRLGRPRGWLPACRREASAGSVGPTRPPERVAARVPPRGLGPLSRATSAGCLSRAGTPPPRRGGCGSAPRRQRCRVRRRQAARPRPRCSAWATRRRHTSGSSPGPDPARPDT